MLEVIARGVLVAVLVAAVATKLIDPRRSAAAMSTFGFETPRSQWATLVLTIAIEAALAVGIALGSDSAAYAGALLMLLFAATLGSAMMRGRAGAPCACFGSGSTVGRPAIARNLVLAALFAVTPSLPGGRAQHRSVARPRPRAGAAALRRRSAVAVLALAREVGMLRLRLGPAAALEISHEGPEVGGSTGLIDRFRLEPRNELALAVFTSVGCHVCRVLAPAVDSLRNEPALSVATLRGERRLRGLGGARDPGRALRDRDGHVGHACSPRALSIISRTWRASSRPPSGGRRSGSGWKHWACRRRTG